MHEGTLDLSVGFMRGQVKMSGDFGALLRLPAAHRRNRASARARRPASRLASVDYTVGALLVALELAQRPESDQRRARLLDQVGERRDPT